MREMRGRAGATTGREIFEVSILTGTFESPVADDLRTILKIVEVFQIVSNSKPPQHRFYMNVRSLNAAQTNIQGWP